MELFKTTLEIYSMFDPSDRDMQPADLVLNEDAIVVSYDIEIDSKPPSGIAAMFYDEDQDGD